MSHTNNIWVPKLQAAQNENYENLKGIIQRIKESSTDSHKYGSTKAKEVQNAMNQQLKRYHAHVSKCSKRMDTIYDDYTIAGIPFHDPMGCRGSSDPYMKFCLEHLCMLGKREAVNTLTADVRGQDYFESAVHAHADYMADIYDVIQALQSGDLSVAEAWIYDHLKSGQISERSADTLTFYIMKVNFLSLLSDISLCSDHEKYSRALEMTTTIFPLFYTKDLHVSELNEMTCCLLFVQPAKAALSKQAQSSQASSNAPAPWLIMYPHLTVSTAKQQACVALRGVAMEAHGLSPASALHTLLRRGVAAVSFLSDSNHSAGGDIDQTQSRTPAHKSWVDLEHVCFPSTSSESAPIPPAVKEHTFHSVLTCPVSREMATPDNPPVLLQCGHVVLSTSMRALPSSRTGRFKCPTCYHEMRQDSCMSLFL